MAGKKWMEKETEFRGTSLGYIGLGKPEGQAFVVNDPDLAEVLGTDKPMSIEVRFPSDDPYKCALLENMRKVKAGTSTRVACRGDGETATEFAFAEGAAHKQVSCVGCEHWKKGNCKETMTLYFNIPAAEKNVLCVRNIRTTNWRAFENVMETLKGIVNAGGKITDYLFTLARFKAKKHKGGKDMGDTWPVFIKDIALASEKALMPAAEFEPPTEDDEDMEDMEVNKETGEVTPKKQEQAPAPAPAKANPLYKTEPTRPERPKPQADPKTDLLHQLTKRLAEAEITVEDAEGFLQFTKDKAGNPLLPQGQGLEKLTEKRLTEMLEPKRFEGLLHAIMEYLAQASAQESTEEAEEAEEEAPPADSNLMEGCQL